jgi:hypothetical protein
LDRTGTIQLSGVAGRTGRGRRRAKPGAASFRSPLTALAVALSLLVQLFAIPYHQALSAPLVASPDAAAISAELKATFGDVAALCVQSDDKGAPRSQGGCCGDQCPFCRFAAQAAALVAPDAPALHEPISVDCETIGIAPAPGAIPAPPTSRNRARGPPFPA